MNEPQVTEKDIEIASAVVEEYQCGVPVNVYADVVAHYRTQVVAEKQREVDNIQFSLNVMDGLLKSQGESIATMREALLAAEKELKFAHENWSDMFHDAVSSCRICKALTLIHAALNTDKK